MLDFTYQNGTKMIFGRAGEAKVGEETRQLGKKVLLHYGGGSIMKSGLYDRVKESLAKAGVQVVELGGVKPNPRLDLVREGIKLCREQGVEAILAVGGGSVIDSAKSIGIGVPVDHDVWDFYEGTAKGLAKAMLPLGVVLTIPAAGSESSNSAVISHEAEGKKYGYGAAVMRPTFAILNPELTYTLPDYQTACGATDMLAHVMERYFSLEQGADLSDRLCEGTMQAIIKNVPMVLASPKDYDARAEVMWAGTVAHNDFIGMGQAGDWNCHNIEHEISAKYDIAHGAGLAIVFPAWMKYSLDRDVMRFAQFAHKVFGVPMDFHNPKATALEGIFQLESWLRRIGMPVRLSDANIDDEAFAHMAQGFMRKSVNGQKRGKFSPLDAAAVEQILKLAL